MYNMDDLMGFVEWLPNNSELFADLDVEVTIAQINKLASSDEGKETLEQLTKQYKSKEMELFKKGGNLIVQMSVTIEENISLDVKMDVKRL